MSTCRGCENGYAFVPVEEPWLKDSLWHLVPSKDTGLVNAHTLLQCTSKANPSRTETDEREAFWKWWSTDDAFDDPYYGDIAWRAWWARAKGGQR